MKWIPGVIMMFLVMVTPSHGQVKFHAVEEWVFNNEDSVLIGHTNDRIPIEVSTGYVVVNTFTPVVYILGRTVERREGFVAFIATTGGTEVVVTLARAELKHLFCVAFEDETIVYLLDE